MRKVIEIDGREVEFLSTASIPRLYRIKFRRDIFADMRRIAAEMKKAEEEQKRSGSEESTLPLETLELFENVAYMMAKHAAGAEVPNTVEEWLDQFEVFSIYQVFPVIKDLWEDNIRQLNTPVKK